MRFIVLKGSLNIFQLFYLFNCRSFRFSLLKIGFFSNPYVLIGIVFVIVLHMAYLYLPFMNQLFLSAGLSFTSWLISLSVALVILPLMAIKKNNQEIY